jgi:hypothetical protein
VAGMAGLPLLDGGVVTGDQLAIPPAALDPFELHQAARAYCHHGWSVIPAAVVGKRALVPWKPWQQTAPDLEQVDRWWRRWPAANVAVITGRCSGLVVVDVDTRHEGEWSLEDLQAEHGPLPWRAVVSTPSGGWHIYLQHPRFRVANSAGRLGPGLDVRGDGGLVLAPPSRRHLDAYRWEVGRPDTVPEIPNGWRKLLRPRRATRTALQAPQTPGGRPGDAARLAGLLRALERAPQGQRNSTLYWCACRLKELLEQGAPSSWAEVLIRAGEAAGLERSEARDTVRSAVGRPAP